MPDESLDPEKISETAEKLSRRVFERFPESGLHRISKELTRLGDRASASASLISRPIYDAETLCVGLSAKIWQKLQIAETAMDVPATNE